MDKAEILRIAQLARLTISETEIPTFLTHFNKVLEHMAKLDELDTTKVEPTSQMQWETSSPSTPQRKDVVTSSWASDEAMRNAPAQVDGFFQVPRVIDE